MHARHIRSGRRQGTAPKAESQVLIFDFPSWYCPPTSAGKSSASVAVQDEALPRVRISRALCTADGALSLGWEGSETFASL